MGLVVGWVIYIFNGGYYVGCDHDSKSDITPYLTVKFGNAKIFETREQAEEYIRTCSLHYEWIKNNKLLEVTINV